MCGKPSLRRGRTKSEEGRIQINPDDSFTRILRKYTINDVRVSLKSLPPSCTGLKSQWFDKRLIFQMLSLKLRQLLLGQLRSSMMLLRIQFFLTFLPCHPWHAVSLPHDHKIAAGAPKHLKERKEQILSILESLLF